MRIRRIRYSLLAIPLILVASLLLSYQQQGQAADTVFAECPAMIQTVFAEIDRNCSSLERNSACYGFQQVQAAFNEEMPDDYFTHPADLAPLSMIDTIQTLPLDPVTSNWGVALMKAQANLPDTVPGQSVVFVLMGDVEVENRVAPENLWRPTNPVSMTALANANVRSGPGTTWNVIGGLDAGTELEADATSPNGSWLRITYENQAAWVSRDLFDVDGTASDLPVADESTRTPMQMFYFRTGFGELACSGAPNQLIVQGPEHVTINLTVNGAEMSIGSTISFRQIDADTVQLSVIEGAAYLNSGRDRVVVPAGFTVIAPLDPADNTIVGAWTEFRALTPDELTAMLPVETLPRTLLNYPIVVPTQDDIQAALNTLPSRGGSNTVWVVDDNGNIVSVGGSSNSGGGSNSGDDDDDNDDDDDSSSGNGGGNGNSGNGGGNGGDDDDESSGSGSGSH
ncbi:MAG: SH3 domain-containing protein [Burkholderiales bacterium]|nr:SH3 domain-containing protein [Anaerolineae bacterium]